MGKAIRKLYKYSGVTDISLQNSYGLTLYVLQIKAIIIAIKWDLNIWHFYSYYNKIIDRKRGDLLFKRL